MLFLLSRRQPKIIPIIVVRLYLPQTCRMLAVARVLSTGGQNKRQQGGSGVNKIVRSVTQVCRLGKLAIELDQFWRCRVKSDDDNGDGVSDQSPFCREVYGRQTRLVNHVNLFSQFVLTVWSDKKYLATKALVICPHNQTDQTSFKELSLTKNQVTRNQIVADGQYLGLIEGVYFLRDVIPILGNGATTRFAKTFNFFDHREKEK